jgi:hypothetical protein
VPLVGDLDDRTDDREASVVRFASEGAVTVSLSLDYGRSFRDIKTVAGRGVTELDLTPYLRERYQYLIKFKLEGRDSLAIKTWVQLAPISLPRLKKGRNRLDYKTRDQHGLASTPSYQMPNMDDRQEMSRYWTSVPKGYDPSRARDRLHGPMELAFHAPPGRKIKWVTVGGHFRAHRSDQAPGTGNEMWLAEGSEGEWKRIHRAAVPAWHQHWHYAYDQEVMLDQPAAMIRVRYVGDPAVNSVRVNLHSVAPDTTVDDPVTVTHAFRMDGKTEIREFRLDRPQRYTIDCPSEPEDVFIRLAVPSDAPGR